MKIIKAKAVYENGEFIYAVDKSAKSIMDKYAGSFANYGPKVEIKECTIKII